MDERRTFPAAVMQFVLACGLCTVVYWLTLPGGEAGGYYPLVLLPYAPAVYGIDRLFLRRSRTMQGLLILNGLLALVLFFSVCFFDGWRNWHTLVLTGCFCLWPAVRGGGLALEPPKLHSMILCLDLSAVLLVLFVAFLSMNGLPVYWGAPILAGCAAALLGVVSCRISRAMGLREWAVFLLAFGALFGIMLLALCFAAAPAGRGVTALWQGLTALALLLLKAIARALDFLCALFPAAQTGERLPAEQLSMPVQEQAPDGGSSIVAVVLAAVILIAALFVLLRFLYRLGRLRTGGRMVSGGKAERMNRQRLSLWRGIKRLLSGFAAWLRQRAFLRRERNTPRGLFFLLVHRCRMGPLRKRPGETPREFLTRLRDSAAYDRALAAALDELIPAVDRALYAQAADNCDFPAARLIRRRIRAAARRQFLRGCREKLHAAHRRRKEQAAGNLPAS